MRENTKLKYIKWKDATNKQKKVRILSYSIHLVILYTCLSVVTFTYTIPALDSISQFLLGNVTNLKAHVSVSFAFYFLSVIIIGTTGPLLFVMHILTHGRYRWFIDLLLLHKLKLDPGLTWL